MTVIDTHTHAFPDTLARRAIETLQAEVRGCGLGLPDTAYTDGTAKGLCDIMDRGGVDRAVLLPVATKPGQAEGINRWTAGFLAGDKGGRVIPFGAVFPGEGVERELEKIAMAGYKGVKLHGDYQRFYADDMRMTEVYRRCGELSLIVVMHAGEDPASPGDVHVTPKRMARVFDRISGVNMVLAHMGGIGCEHEAARLLSGAPGLWVDTAYMAGRLSPEEMTELIRSYGADRVLFGSDCPWNDPAEDMALINACDLSDEEREGIFSGNFLRLMSCWKQEARSKRQEYPP